MLIERVVFRQAERQNGFVWTVHRSNCLITPGLSTRPARLYKDQVRFSEETTSTLSQDIDEQSDGAKARVRRVLIETNSMRLAHRVR